jgi:hypothetical protein
MESLVNIEDKLNEFNIIKDNTIICGKIEEINVKFLERLKILSNEGNNLHYMLLKGYVPFFS